MGAAAHCCGRRDGAPGPGGPGARVLGCERERKVQDGFGQVVGRGCGEIAAVADESGEVGLRKPGPFGKSGLGDLPGVHEGEGVGSEPFDGGRDSHATTITSEQGFPLSHGHADKGGR